MATSSFIYINKQLPTAYMPPKVTGDVTLSADELRRALGDNDVRITPAGQGNPADDVVSVFEHEEVLFGDPTWLPANRAHWAAKVQWFIDRGEPIQFVAMAFPYKVPNPVKTGRRRAPDAGEALMLRRFQAVLDAVRLAYPPGGHLTILEEGILGRCQGVDPADIAAYRAGIPQITDVAGVSDIGYHSLDDMGTRIEDFEARWYFEAERLRRLWDEGEPEIRRGYAEANPGERTTVPTRSYEPATLIAALDPDQTDSALRYVREYLDLVAHRQFFAYRALLNLRDASGYLEAIAPHALKLTVSPKPENLAVIPVNRWTGILPYHGATVHSPGADQPWTIEYHAALGDMGDVEAVHLEGDVDPAPICYRRPG